MSEGVMLIARERKEKQIDKHGFTGEHHADHPEWYDRGQLIDASRFLSIESLADIDVEKYLPFNWDLQWWVKMCAKPHEKRLVISAALIAAELDRLHEIFKRKS